MPHFCQEVYKNSYKGNDNIMLGKKQNYQQDFAMKEHW